MMIPNNSGLLRRRLAQDIYSQFQYAPPITVRCAVVSLKEVVAKTSVRVDQSASRGNVEEVTIVAKILFPSSVVIAKEDRFDIAGKMLRVVNSEPRFSVGGRLDHYEVDFGVFK